MDKGTFILSAGLTIMVGVYALNMTRADIGTKENADVYAFKRQARQISATGFHLAINRLRYNTNWTTGFQNRPIMDGTLNVSVDTRDLPPGLRRITSVGDFFGRSYRTIAIVRVPPASRNFDLGLLTVQSALEMQGRSLSIERDNNFLVNGKDWISDTTYSTATALHGIGASTSHNLTVEEVTTALSRENASSRVIGQGTTPSVTALSSTIDMDELEDEVQRISTIIHRSGSLGREKAWGTLNTPEIVYATKSLTIDKPLTGAGILFVDGNLTVKSTLRWDGYLIVQGNRINVKSNGDVNVKGATFFGKGGSLEFGSEGSMNIGYSSNILQTLSTRLFVPTDSKPEIVSVFEETNIGGGGSRGGDDD